MPRPLLIAVCLLYGLPAGAQACWNDVAQRHGVPADLLYAVAKVESSLDPKAVNRSHFHRTRSIDIGLMQINSRHLPKLAQQGITEARLPRTTSQWAQFSNPVGARDLQRGDFVFFNTLGGRYSHMGIFVGNGQFVHAPSSGGTVQRVRLDNVYFAKRFTEARSIFA